MIKENKVSLWLGNFENTGSDYVDVKSEYIGCADTTI